MADRAPPLSKILARRKDAPKGEKGHSIPLLAIWKGEFRNTATLDESVAFIQLVDGNRITRGRESEHWLNVYDHQRTPSRSEATAHEAQRVNDESVVDDIPF